MTVARLFFTLAASLGGFGVDLCCGRDNLT
jgi:hypothetical protein